MIPLFLLTALVPSMLLAQNEVKKDTVPSTKEVKNRNVMLNASSDNQPREISIGLPSSLGTTIFEDGLPVSYNIWPCLPYKHWRGGTSYERTSLMSLSETTLRNGSVGYTVDTYSREGGKQFQGLLNYTANHFGMQRFDINLSGPIAKGWGYSAGTYQNFDTGTNKIGYANLQDRTQIYKLGLTKSWSEKRGKASLFYKYSRSQGLSDGNGPFYYKGDGSITSLPGFDLGTDSYIPADGIVEYMNVMNGEIVKSTMKDRNLDYTHEVNFRLEYAWENGNKFALRSKYKDGNTLMTNRFLSGIDEITTERGYTYEDQTPYAGQIQNRYIMQYVGFERDWLTNAELTGQRGNHAWRIGMNEWYNRAGVESSTANMAHEVKANPQSLLLDGQRYWGFNNGAEYYDGHENKLALYVSDDWNVTPSLWLSAGLRLEYYNIAGDAALNLDGKENNSRVSGFHLKKEGVTTTRFNENWLNPAATLNARYTLLPGFGMLGEYVFNRQRPVLENYAGFSSPSTAPVDVHMGRAGLFYNNQWMQLVSQFSYISQSNYKARIQLTKQISGNSETITEPINYTISTIGWTTDAVITPFKGFTFHGLFTLQSPRYKEFIIQPRFSDGSSDRYDFSEKTVTGMSRIIVELDPSYSFGNWRLWTSFRYQSKQYINKANSLYFNGRWETFGGVDYRMNKRVTLSANVINFLNQKGASGSISAADLIEDASVYKNYLMSGSYIRPFTVEFAAHINF